MWEETGDVEDLECEYGSHQLRLMPCLGLDLFGSSMFCCPLPTIVMVDTYVGRFGTLGLDKPMTVLPNIKHPAWEMDLKVQMTSISCILLWEIYSHFGPPRRQ